MPFYRFVANFQIMPVFVLVLFASCASPASQAEEVTPTPVPTPVIPTKPTYKVARGEVVRILEFTARLVPIVEQELYFKTSGRIQSVLGSRGDEVERGQLLASLETETSNADVRRAEINLEVAKLNRELFLMQGKNTSEEYAIYLKMRGFDVEVAQLALDEVNARVDLAQVKAPFKGTLLSVSITPDRSVEAFKSVMVLAEIGRASCRERV